LLLEEAGFEILLLKDMRVNFRAWTNMRYHYLVQDRKENIAKHGQGLVDRLEFFYGEVLLIRRLSALIDTIIGGQALQRWKPWWRALDGSKTKRELRNSRELFFE
jgi:hypothetical protein